MTLANDIDRIIKGIDKIQDKVDENEKNTADLDTMVRIHITQDEYLRGIQEDKHNKIEAIQTKNEDRLLSLELFKNDFEKNKKFEEDAKLKIEKNKKEESWFRNKIHSIIYISIGIFILWEKLRPVLANILRGTYENRNP